MEYTMNSRIAKLVSVLAASIAIALSAGWMTGASAQAPAPADKAAMHQRRGKDAPPLALLNGKLPAHAAERDDGAEAGRHALREPCAGETNR